MPITSRQLPTLLLGVALALTLAACGVADTGSSAVTAAKLKAREAEQAQAARAQLEKQIDATQQQAEQRRKEIEAATR